MTTTTKTNLRDLLIAAIDTEGSDSMRNPLDTKELRAAATGLVLAWVENTEGAFHPHDPGHVTVDYGASCELAELMREHPWLDRAWRKLMAAKQLASLIATGLESDSTMTRAGLVVIASGIGDPLEDADCLEALALIAVGRD
jgi:hypothetical protein